MRRTLLLIVLPVLVLGIPVLGATSAPKTAITGFAPYILGMGTREVLRADPELATGNYPMWSNNLLTQRYGRAIVTSISGVNSVATLGLQFWRGRLAVVILKWPSTAFGSVSDWRHAAEDLHNRITGAYASEIVKRHTVISASVWMIDLADAQGNQFSAWSNDRPLDIAIVYLWAPYVKALEAAPAPDSGY
jgi:hypothetical protein